MKSYTGTGYTIYAHVNKQNGKMYIGQTCQTDLTRRWTGGNGYKECPHFYAAIQKYGWDEFDHVILQTGLTAEEANAYEQGYISFFETNTVEKGYNIQDGGYVGGKMSDEGRASFLEKHTGQNNPKAKPVAVFDLSGKLVETFQTQTEAAKFLGVTDVSEPCLLRRGTVANHIVRFLSEVDGVLQLPEEEIYHPYEYRLLYKPVIQYTLDGDFVAFFNSVKDAAAKFHVHNSAISSCARMIRKSSCGYQWRYAVGVIPSKISPVKRTVCRGASHHISKRVSQCDINGSVIATFSSVTEASAQTHVSARTISRCCNGHTLTGCGYVWKFANG